MTRESDRNSAPDDERVETLASERDSRRDEQRTQTLESERYSRPQAEAEAPASKRDSRPQAEAETPASKRDSRPQAEAETPASKRDSRPQAEAETPASKRDSRPQAEAETPASKRNSRPGEVQSDGRPEVERTAAQRTAAKPPAALTRLVVAARTLARDALDLARGRHPHLFLLMVLASLAVLVPRGIRDESPTEDEWAHLIRGISYWQNRDMRIHAQHPPLANAIVGLSVGFDKDNPQTSQFKTWQEGYAPGLEYIKVDYGRARAQLQRARRVSMLLLPLLAAYVFYFCRRFFGFTTAAAALLLVAYNPTLIAQTRYVATDMPAAVFGAIAVGEFIRYLITRQRYALFTMPLALAGAMLAKHNGVLWIPVFGLIALLVAALGRGRFEGAPVKRRLLSLFGHFALAGVVLLLASNIVYKFDRTGMTVAQILEHPEPQHWVTSKYHNGMLEQRSPLPSFPQSLRIPVPYIHLFGLFAVQEQNRGGYPTFFMGESSRDGHWAYFPVMLLIKSPPSLLALLAVGAALLYARRRLSLASAVLLAAACAFLAILMRSNLNMGVRHAAPIVPLISILGARAFAHAWELLSEWRAALPELVPAWPWLAAGLLFVPLSTFGSAALAGPDYLGYFNVFAGGRKGGHEISIVGDDWGQDRARFVKYVKQHDIRPLYYHSETATRKLEVRHLGLEFTDIGCSSEVKPGSWVAIHAQYVRRYQGSRRCAKWMQGRKPVVTINEHVYLYWIPPDSDARPR